MVGVKTVSAAEPARLTVTATPRRKPPAPLIRPINNLRLHQLCHKPPALMINTVSTIVSTVLLPIRLINSPFTPSRLCSSVDDESDGLDRKPSITCCRAEPNTYHQYWLISWLFPPSIIWLIKCQTVVKHVCATIRSSESCTHTITVTSGQKTVASQTSNQTTLN